MEEGYTHDALPMMRLRRVFGCSRTFWILWTKTNNNNNNNKKKIMTKKGLLKNKIKGKEIKRRLE